MSPSRAVTRHLLAVASALLVAGGAHAQHAQLVASASDADARAAVPFAVGEELRYKATFGKLRAGTAIMRVAGIDTVRGRAAYHVVFTLDGGIPFFGVHDRFDSWIDVRTLASLRHEQRIAEGRYHRTTVYEIYPERAQYQKDADTLRASVANPVDDGSFLYVVRAAGVRVGEERRDDRYFRPDRNPIVLAGLRADTVTVRAGTFATVVVRPSIRTRGIFAEGGEAQVWFSDDADRWPVQIKSRFSGFSVTLTLQSATRGTREPAPGPIVATAAGAGGR
jgi:hypothetical protein